MTPKIRRYKFTALLFIILNVGNVLAEDYYYNNFEDNDDVSFWGLGYPSCFISSADAQKQGLMNVNYKGLLSIFQEGKASSGVRALKLDITLPDKIKGCSWNYWHGPKLNITLDKPVYLSGYIYPELLPPDIDVGLGWSIIKVNPDGKIEQKNRIIVNRLNTKEGWIFFQENITDELKKLGWIKDSDKNIFLDFWYLHINSKKNFFHDQKLVLFLDDVKISSIPAFVPEISDKNIKQSDIISDDPYIVNYTSFFKERPEAKNICDNSSFETGLKNWDIQGNCEWYIDFNDSVHGKNSLMISGSAKIKSRPMPVEKAQDYTFSFYARSNDLSATINSGDFSFKLTSSWQRYSIPITTKSNLYSVSLNVSCKKSVWIDAVQVEKGQPTNYQIPPSVEIGLSTNRKDNIYYPDETILFDVNVFNGTNFEIKSNIKYKIIDFKKDIISSGNTPIQIIPGNGTKISTELKLPKGYYKVIAELNGKDLKSKTTELSLGIISPISNSLTGEDAFFGMSSFEPDSLINKLFLKESGVKYTAFYNTLYWRHAPKNWKEYNPQWKYADEKIDNALKQNAIPLVGLFGIPSWTGVSNTIPNSPEEVTDNIINGWYDYTYDVVNRYKNRVKYWELWGEFMHEPLEARALMYIKFVKAASEAIRKADPNAKIVGFGEDTARKEGTTWSLIPQLEAHFKLGSLDYVDIIGLDAYTYPASPESADFSGMIEKLKETIRKYNHGKDKDIWITEVGWKGLDVLYYDLSYGEGGNYLTFVTELEQAENIVRMNLIAKAKGIKKFLTFPALSGSITCEFPYTLINYGGLSPKCAYVAYNHMVNCLINAEFEQEIKIANNIICYAFNSGKTTVVAIWNYSSSHTPLTIKTHFDNQKIKMTNMVGTPLELPDNEIITLTGSPLYFTVDESEKVKMLDAFRKAEIEEISFNTRWNKGAEQLAVELNNKTSCEWNGHISIDNPKNWTLLTKGKTCKIAPGEKKELGFAFSPDSLTDSEKLNIKIQGDKELFNIEMETLPCSFTQTPPELGPDFSKWKTGKPLQLTGKDIKSYFGSVWKGEEDLSALMWSAWNYNAFYLGLEVTDDEFAVPYSEIECLWANDSLLVAFDPLCNASGNDGYQTDDYEYFISMNKSGNVVVHCGTGFDTSKEKTKVQAYAMRIGNKTYYEMIFPWSAFSPFSLDFRRNFRFNIAVMDNDGDQTKYPRWKGFHQCLQMSDGICGCKRPGNFKNIILLEPLNQLK